MSEGKLVSDDIVAELIKDRIRKEGETHNTYFVTSRRDILEIIRLREGVHS